MMESYQSTGLDFALCAGFLSAGMMYYFTKHIKTVCIYILLISASSIPAMADSVYCPEKIHCTQENNLSSCNFEQDSKLYWDKILSKQNKSGTYKNTYVSAPYYTYDQSVALCVYTHENVYHTLTLTAKPESNLEMLNEDHPSWRSEETWWECAPKHPQDCPLQEQAALMIQNSTQKILYLSNQWQIKPNQFARIYQQNIPQGNMDVYDKSNYIGRIMVDPTNRLRITQIISGNQDIEEISQIQGFNAVKIE